MPTPGVTAWTKAVKVTAWPKTASTVPGRGRLQCHGGPSLVHALRERGIIARRRQEVGIPTIGGGYRVTAHAQRSAAEVAFPEVSDTLAANTVAPSSNVTVPVGVPDPAPEALRLR